MIELMLFLGALSIASLAQESKPGRPSPKDADLPSSGSAPSGPDDESWRYHSGDPSIQSAMNDFGPFVEKQISELEQIPDAQMNDWQWVVSRLPYLTEAVSLWYVLEDPNVPNEPKLLIAGALLYLISPADLIPDEMFPIVGFSDDAAAIAAALYNVYGYITQEHIENAKTWLRRHGVEPKPLFALRKTFEMLP